MLCMSCLLCLAELSLDSHKDSLDDDCGKTGLTRDFCRWNSSALVVCAKRRRCSCSAGSITVLDASSALSSASAAGVPFLGNMAGRVRARSLGVTFSLQQAGAFCH